MHSNRLDIKIALDDSTACAPPPPCGSAPVLRRVSRLFPFIFFRPRVYFLLLLLRPSPSSSPPSFASIQLGFVMRGASGCLMALAKQTQTSTLLENPPPPVPSTQEDEKLIGRWGALLFWPLMVLMFLLKLIMFFLLLFLLCR